MIKNHKKYLTFCFLFIFFCTKKSYPVKQNISFEQTEEELMQSYNFDYAFTSRNKLTIAKRSIVDKNAEWTKEIQIFYIWNEKSEITEKIILINNTNDVTIIRENYLIEKNNYITLDRSQINQLRKLSIDEIGELIENINTKNIQNNSSPLACSIHNLIKLVSILFYLKEAHIPNNLSNLLSDINNKYENNAIDNNTMLKSFYQKTINLQIREIRTKNRYLCQLINSPNKCMGAIAHILEQTI